MSLRGHPRNTPGEAFGVAPWAPSISPSAGLLRARHTPTGVPQPIEVFLEKKNR